MHLCLRPFPRGNPDMRRSVLLFSALAMACGGSNNNKPSRKLVILHTNDEHSHLVGYGPEVDDFPTAAAAGSGITAAAKPIHGKDVITTPNGMKVGFVGIMGANAAYKAPTSDPVTFSLAPGQSSLNQVASLAQIFTDIQPVVDGLRRDDKVDLVVAMSHSGADVNNPFSEDFQIAQNVSGIDVIVSGHTHTQVLAHPIVNRYTNRTVIVQQAGRYGDTVGRIPLTVNGDGTITFDTANAKLIAVTDATTPTDATVLGVVNATIPALESQNISGQQFSFMQYTLAEILA